MVRSLALLAAALPFAFALLRATRPDHDFRMLWLAIATFAGASLVMLLVRRRESGIGAAIGMAIAALIVATIFGAGTIRLMMAGLPLGALIVAFAFSLCFAFAYALLILGALPTTEDDAVAASQRPR